MEAAIKTLPTILVVDDDEDMLFMMQQKLIKEGYDPIFSPNGINIMAIIAQRHPDLVLLDINMDGINGADVCREIKNNPETQDIPIVMYSANDNIETVMKECGADAYLTKPFEPGKLKVIFNNLLHPEQKTDGLPEAFAQLKAALQELDKELVDVNGNQLKPSQCYRLDTDPVHMLFNTNCPDTLKKKIEDILLQHLPSYNNKGNA